MAGFRKGRRPQSVTAHVCHRVADLPRQSRGSRLSRTLGGSAFEEKPAKRTFFTVKRKLPEARIAGPPEPEKVIVREEVRVPHKVVVREKEKVTVDDAIKLVQNAGAWPEAKKESSYEREVSMLERRLNKLNGVLEDREKEIQRLKTAVATDEGVASMYKDVQGIDSDDENAEAKKAMMAEIFKANLKLHERVAAAAQ